VIWGSIISAPTASGPGTCPQTLTVLCFCRAKNTF